MDSLVVAYCGDEILYRKKQCGMTLTDQLLLSVRSVRANWSKDIEIIFIHTMDISKGLLELLSTLQVTPIRASRVINSEFLMANKILVGEMYSGSKDILFLDCDTVIHKGVDFERSREILVTYDIIRNIERDDYRDFFGVVEVKMPEGDIPESPAFEYYVHNSTDLFPVFNSGVFFLKKSLQNRFYYNYENIFHKAYDVFKDKEWSFYIEQISFSATIVKLKICYDLLPKGYNFICTPRAPFLKEWSHERIVIEHYAGDNGSPLVIL